MPSLCACACACVAVAFAGVAARRRARRAGITTLPRLYTAPTALRAFVIRMPAARSVMRTHCTLPPAITAHFTLYLLPAADGDVILRRCWLLACSLCTCCMPCSLLLRVTPALLRRRARHGGICHLCLLLLRFVARTYTRRTRLLATTAHAAR